MNIHQYIKAIAQRHRQGNATEHTFRGDLQQLVEALLPDLRATNEPRRQQCGAPDYIVTRHDVPVGFIEAKDIGDRDLDGQKASGNKAQFDRYRASLDNLIFTDYLDFHLYRNGELVTQVAIGKVTPKGIQPLPQHFDTFTRMMLNFGAWRGQSITSSRQLAGMMAGNARLLADVIEQALNSDTDHQDDSTLKDQMLAFKHVLIHDITPQDFADVYAQTIAYGMFAARLHDADPHTFSRHKAAELIPKSNPFLRRLFQYIAGYDLDDRIRWIVDSLAEIFRATNVGVLLRDFGKGTQRENPVIHFYEDFLSEYDPGLRKKRGVWYTPQPVVSFIVRAVDEILKTEFGLPEGLADYSKTRIRVDVQGKKTPKEVHRVQILDPAAGTGTFLAEIVRYIHKKFENQMGIWSSYVEDHLIPRLNGFELLMASYTMAHLNLDQMLSDTGYAPTKQQRLRIYLTNSLEEHHPDTGTLFATWLSNEASEANYIKRDTPVMVVIGNPPYSGESANKGEWIMNLMADYKKEPGGKEKLKERNPKWINDDYVKFIRYGQHFIEKNGNGILAFINPHGFLDNPTFRGMRWNLLTTFDRIYTIDLHGNAKKKETAPDGGEDNNVFDIQQGVSINLFVKTGRKKSNQLGRLFHYDLYGTRESKYDFLHENSIQTIGYKELPNVAPDYFFVSKNWEQKRSYNSGFLTNDLFIINGVGLTTAHDEFVIKESKTILLNHFLEFQKSERSADDLHKKFNVKKKQGWDILQGYDNINNELCLEKYIKPILYRPFDSRFIFYEDRLVWRTVKKIMQHFLKGDNIALIIGRQGQVVGSMQWNLSFITKSMTDFNLYYRGGGMSFPLYLYPDSPQQTIDHTPDRTPNLAPAIVNQIADGLKLTFTPEKEDSPDTFAPIDLLDYIYAVLHSPTYREKFKEFLKIDFPRVPYPDNPAIFWKLVDLGGELRQLHLMESPLLDPPMTSYPLAGSNRVEKLRFDEGKVWINPGQYFEGVPEVAWTFYIGGYQPAQKWLKDRRQRELSFEDIRHYQKIITALTHTDRLMQEIDRIELLPE